MKNSTGTIILFFLLFLTVASCAEAITAKFWTETSFIGVTREETLKMLGQPTDSGELNTWLISDSPDFLMMGMLAYENDKVTSVFSVCQPKVTFEQVQELQLQSPLTTVVSDDARGILFKYKEPAGPVYMCISPADDASTGPMICESVSDPLVGSEVPVSEPAKAGKSVAKLDKAHVKDLLMKDIFDWQQLDEAAKIALVDQIKEVWRSDGYETDANAIDAKTIVENMVLGDQANVFESACKAANIDMEPYWKIYNQE